MFQLVFVTFNEDSIYTYLYCHDTVQGMDDVCNKHLKCIVNYMLGPLCELIGTTKLPFGYKPLMLYNGEVSCQTLTGRIAIIRLDTHSFRDDLEISEDKV